ncbi:MAG: M23 family metallopeptidase [Marinifilaceae bacterium]
MINYLLTIIAFNILFTTHLFAQQNDVIQPVNGEISLSGNFGELRATHLHAGIDFRTGGKEGLPVKCVKDGMLARVAVSPTGYGNALYIEHPDGTTSVYAHLQRFNEQLAQRTRSAQYRRSSFAIDLNVKDQRIYFKQGDIIGYSGNSGSSGGPHLHFEMRETGSQHPKNPLLYYNIVDTIPPQIKHIVLFGIDSLGVEQPTHNVKTPFADTCFTPYTQVGLAIHAEDRMNNSANKLGVYKMSLWANNKEVYCFTLNKSSFAQGKYINDVKYYSDYRNGRTTYRCFGTKQNSVLGLNNRDNGVITLSKDSAVIIKCIATDINGNTSQVQFVICQRGNIEPIEQEVLKYGKKHILQSDSVELHLPENALFSSTANCFSVKTDSATAQLYISAATQPVPLFEKGQLIIKGNYPRTAVICEKNSAGRLSALSTQNKNKQLKATIGSLSNYTVAFDTIAPTINYLGATGQRLNFKIQDNLSGIDSYKGEVNGKWTLFVYDAKNKLLYCNMNEPAFTPNAQNKIVITVTDKVGNKAKKEIQYGIK